MTESLTASTTAAVQPDLRDRGIDFGRADAAREQLEATIRAALRTMQNDTQGTSLMMADDGRSCA